MKQQQRVKAAGAALGSARSSTIDSAAPHEQRAGSTTAVKNAITLTDDDIAARAYSYWAARNFQAGCPEEDWYRAIEELYREQN